MTSSVAAPGTHYLGRTLTWAEVDQQSWAFAEFLREHHVQRGDRVLLQLQNMPQALIACQAVWRLGAVVVPANPMYKSAELAHLLGDCQPKVAVVLDALYGANLRLLLEEEYGSLITVTTSAADYADPAIAAELGLRPTPVPDATDFVDIVAARTVHGVGEFDRSACPPADIAALVYTSGTTGPPKGAMITHANLTVEVAAWQEVYRFRPGDAIMGLAPFFHITGLVADLTVAVSLRTPIVYMHRFDPEWALRWIERYQPTSLVAAITVYTALLNHPAMSSAHVRSLRTCLSGGAPVSPETVDWWRRTAGGYLRNCYGLTETASLSTVTPEGSEAPVDPASGVLSVGQAVPGTTVTVRDPDDRVLGAGEVGEIVINGPQIAAGYWDKPDETASSFRATGMHTGDVGFLDDQGWLYLVDRSKDLIVTSGYKVWPREVEEVLMRHPAVLEASVIGAPDSYRGECVVAYVTPRPGQSIDAPELIDFCRREIAVYKAPREVTVVAELPKSAAGKILRRELRQKHHTDHNQ